MTEDPTTSRLPTTRDALLEADHQQHLNALMWDRDPYLDDEIAGLEALSELRPLPEREVEPS